MNLLLKASLVVSLVLLAGCDQLSVYHSYRHIPASGWEKRDTFTFHVGVNDSLLNDSTPTTYELQLLIRNRTDYKYRTLALYVAHNFPDTTTCLVDSVHFNIADDNGRWQGKGISGLYESYQTVVTAPIVGSQQYTVRVASMMNDSILTGLNDVGVIFQKKSN